MLYNPNHYVKYKCLNKYPSKTSQDQMIHKYPLPQHKDKGNKDDKGKAKQLQDNEDEPSGFSSSRKTTTTLFNASTKHTNN